jgi:hypothetical protein
MLFEIDNIPPELWVVGITGHSFYRTNIGITILQLDKNCFLQFAVKIQWAHLEFFKRYFVIWITPDRKAPFQEGESNNHNPAGGYGQRLHCFNPCPPRVHGTPPCLKEMYPIFPDKAMGFWTGLQTATRRRSNLKRIGRDGVNGDRSF